MEWARWKDGSITTTFGYRRIVLDKPEGKGWRLTLFNQAYQLLWSQLRDIHDSPLRTKDLKEAKRRALKRVVAMLKMQREDIDAHIELLTS